MDGEGRLRGADVVIPAITCNSRWGGAEPAWAVAYACGEIIGPSSYILNKNICWKEKENML